MTRARTIAIVIVATLAAAIATVVGIRRGRVGTAPSPSTSMAEMPGMPATTKRDSAKRAMSTGAVGLVELSPAQMHDIGLTFGVVARRTMSDSLRTVGTVTVNETHVAQVAPRFAGFAERLLVDFTGAVVRRGQPMIELYAPDVYAAEEELVSAGALSQSIRSAAVPGVPASSTDLVAAARQRLRLWDVPDAEIDEVLRTGRARSTVMLSAPIGGVVTDKSVVRGQSVVAGQALYTIADLSDVWVIVDVREADASRVRIGTVAQVELASRQGRSFPGRITYIYPTLDTSSRALRARIVVANPRGDLRPGVSATVYLSSPSRVALTVPSSAVVRTGERSIVFIEEGTGRLAPREIAAGATVGDLIEVHNGLANGERVVTSAQFLLSSESNLAEVMRGMMAQLGGGDREQMPDMKDMPGMGSAPAPQDSAALRDKGADMRDMNGMPGMAPTSPKSGKPPETKP